MCKSCVTYLRTYLPGWSCTGEPDPAMPLRDWQSSKAQPSVVVPGSAPGPSMSEGTIREKRFLCLLTTAVELTPCRHLTSPQWPSTFPEETQNSLYAIVHVLPLKIDVNSVNSTTTTWPTRLIVLSDYSICISTCLPASIFVSMCIGLSSSIPTGPRIPPPTDLPNYLDVYLYKLTT